MEITLSTKGQVVLPRAARQKLRLAPGAKLNCRVSGHSLILTPQSGQRAEPKLVRDPLTRLRVTQGAADGPRVTSAQIRAALADFP